jgi:hypothetical protein
VIRRKITPYPFQEADVKDLLAHDATGFVVAEVGAGKTIIGAETARRSGARTKLIIALPGTIADPWVEALIGKTDDETGEWIDGLEPDARIRRIEGTAPGKEAMSDLELGEPGYYFMSPQVFTRWKPTHLRPDLMIVDEAHLMGNRDREGGKLLKKAANMAGSRIVMSGTPVRNQFENLWTLLRFVYPERSDVGDIADIGSQRWIDNYCATEADHFSPTGRRVVGELVPGRLASLVPCWRQHFKRAECCEFHPEGFLANLPAPVVIHEYVELTSGQKHAMKQMQDDYVAYLNLAAEEWKALPLAERKKRPLVTKLPIVRETRLSQMTLAMPSLIPRPYKPSTAKDDPGWIETMWEGAPMRQQLGKEGFPLWDVIFEPDAVSPKLDKLVEVWKKVQEPIVAATNSKKFAELAVRRLNAQGIRAFEWSSSASQAERDAAKQALRDGGLDISVGVVEAIGTGIDGLQEGSGVLVSLNKSRDMTMETQLEGRLDRRGQKRKAGVLHIEIIAVGSTDQDVIDKQLALRLKLNKSLRREVSRR